MTTKKAQGMSMTTIVIAAIALVVLIVLIMIFTGRIGGFTKGLDSCTGQGGFCVKPISAATKTHKATLDGIILDVNGDGKYTEPEDYRTISGTGCRLKNVCIKGMRS
jgi:hypothetical protein